MRLEPCDTRRPARWRVLAASLAGLACIPPPATDIERQRHVRRAEGIGEPADPGSAIGQRCRGRGCLGDGHRLRPMARGDPPQFGGDQVERLVPGDALPARVGIALGSCAPEWMCQPVPVVDQLRRGSALGAEGLARGMARIRLERSQATILDDGDSTAARYAECAVGSDSLGRGCLVHGVQPLARARLRCSALRTGKTKPAQGRHSSRDPAAPALPNLPSGGAHWRPGDGSSVVSRFGERAAVIGPRSSPRVAARSSARPVLVSITCPSPPRLARAAP